MDDNEDGEQGTPPVAETRKEVGRRGKKEPSKMKTVPRTTTVAGGWLAQAATTGSFVNTPGSDHGKDEDDGDANTDEAVGSITSLPPTQDCSSLGGGMPAWGSSTGKHSLTDTTTEPKAAPSRGLGGGRPSWAPAPPRVAGPDPESAAKEVFPESITKAGDDSGLPDWLAAAATAATKVQVMGGYGAWLGKLAGVIALAHLFLAFYERS